MYEPSQRLIEAYARSLGCSSRHHNALRMFLSASPYEVLGTIAWEAHYDGRTTLPVLVNDKLEMKAEDLFSTQLSVSREDHPDLFAALIDDLNQAARDGTISAQWGRLTIDNNGEAVIEITSAELNEGLPPRPASPTKLTRTTPWP